MKNKTTFKQSFQNADNFMLLIKTSRISYSPESQLYFKSNIMTALLL